jgi:tRNA G18 (ribose-2'-O)-methylase SpoU
VVLKRRAILAGAAPETFAGGAGGVALVLSSEGAGVSAEAEALLAAGRAARVGVPLRAACESLNVGVAGGILMYVLGAREWEKPTFNGNDQNL